MAFKHLFYQYTDSLQRFINYYIHDTEKSQEIVLDIFTYVWEHRETLELRLTFKAYLFQAAKNNAFTYLRDRKTLLYLDDVNYEEANSEDWHSIDENGLNLLIQEAVSLLPEKCREIFKKSREDCLSNKEISEALNISEKTVENQMTIALKRIKAYLGKQYYYLF